MDHAASVLDAELSRSLSLLAHLRQDLRPETLAVMMPDIRKGRSAELRMEVAKALCAHCVEILGLSDNRLNVEFTQHSDEMCHPALGGYSPEWSPGEQ